MNNASGHIFLLTNVRLVSQSDFWVVSTLSQISRFFPTISKDTKHSLNVYLSKDFFSTGRKFSPKSLPIFGSKFDNLVIPNFSSTNSINKGEGGPDEGHAKEGHADEGHTEEDHA